MQLTPIESALPADDEDFGPLLKRFVAESLPSLVKNISGYYAQKNWAALKAEVHRLKGVGGGYGYPMLTDVCKRIEAEIKSENVAALAQMVSELNEYHQRIQMSNFAKQ
ncbi:MAG: Hpt domain-containing protein [Gammaproteobacteria bacterium]|nr:Hpt domain-containing protein [Gammaproteobacteria bacterium]